MGNADADNRRDPADVAEEGELLAQWLDAQVEFYTSDERAQQNFKRAAAFIREAYPTPAPPITVRARLTEMRADMLALVEALNRADYLDDALKCQQVAVHIDTLTAMDGNLDDVAWPPRALPCTDPEDGFYLVRAGNDE